MVGHIKDHLCVQGLQSLAVQPYCVKGWVVCGTVYGDMQSKDLLRSIARVGNCIPVQDFYLVLHAYGLR